ncbi:GGDEF domain-containing protein [Falsochrobactrum shanghaiense]|uniref:diguanylate cyclase n=1 Tax=Falsochrobactrum shanghaiense TaxID=2201899 RepID=A0A316JA83_9HYPH|nr:GGDEF domain-containing protein [Falsochrobactrum shanghaiense]PWL18394.1 GGDEF domain-containing protein [Falsochrobactrum shanghaiense]
MRLFRISKNVWKRTIAVALIAAFLSISFSVGVRLVVGAEADRITDFTRLALPFLIAIPLGLFWFSYLEKIEESYRKAVKRASELARIASVDPLTGVLNRRSFIEQFEAASGAGVKGWLLIADIDYLKNVNDQYGHLAGDAAVIAIAQALVQELPPDSLIARIGGDEFCAFVPKASCSNLDAVVDNINVSATAILRKTRPEITLPVTASIGSFSCKPNQTFEEILSSADEKLYRKKRARVQ